MKMKKKTSWLFTTTLLMFLFVGVFTSCDDDDDEDNTQQDVSVSVTGVSLNVSSLSLLPGGSYTLTATVTPENAADKTVTWNCSDENIVLLTDNEDGTATITVSEEAEENNKCTVTVTTKDENFTAECIVTVITEEIEETEVETVEVLLNAADSVAFNGTVSLAADGSLNLLLKAFIGNEEVEDENIIWSATVNVSGSSMDLVEFGVMDGSGLIQISGMYISFLTEYYPITITATVNDDDDDDTTTIYTLSAEITEGESSGKYALTLNLISNSEGEDEKSSQ